MASYAVPLSKHATLGAGVVDTVQITADFLTVEVANRATTGAGISFTLDGTDPTVLGDNTYWVGAGQSVVVEFGNSDTVELISTTADAYSVTGIDRS